MDCIEGLDSNSTTISDLTVFSQNIDCFSDPQRVIDNLKIIARTHKIISLKETGFRDGGARTIETLEMIRHQLQNYRVFLVNAVDPSGKEKDGGADKCSVALLVHCSLEPVEVDVGAKYSREKVQCLTVKMQWKRYNLVGRVVEQRDLYYTVVYAHPQRAGASDLNEYFKAYAKLVISAFIIVDGDFNYHALSAQNPTTDPLPSYWPGINHALTTKWPNLRQCNRVGNKFGRVLDLLFSTISTHGELSKLSLDSGHAFGNEKLHHNPAQFRIYWNIAMALDGSRQIAFPPLERCQV